MPDPPSAALEVARAALRSRPAGLVTDFDGTLSPIVADPAAAGAAPGAREALERLAHSLAVVAIVTGRAAGEARRMIGSDRVLVVGNHGLEWLSPGEPAPEPAPGLADLPAALREALAAVPAADGVVVEDKRLSATVHYRNAPDPEAARRAIVEAVTPRLAPGLVLRHGRMSVELRPAEADKGAAVRALAERHRLRGLLALGDDVTDLDMFRAARELREVGSLRAACIAVSGDDESPPEVAAAADALVVSPDAVVALLERLADD